MIRLSMYYRDFILMTWTTCLLAVLVLACAICRCADWACPPSQKDYTRARVYVAQSNDKYQRRNDYQRKQKDKKKNEHARRGPKTPNNKVPCPGKNKGKEGTYDFQAQAHVDACEHLAYFGFDFLGSLADSYVDLYDASMWRGYIIDSFNRSSLNLDRIMYYSERFFALYKVLSMAQKIPDFQDRVTHLKGVLYLELSAFVNKSLVKSLAEYISGTDFGFSAQAPSVDVVKQFFSTVRGSWDDIRGSNFSTVGTQLLALAISVGMCDASSVEFSIGGFKVFSHEVLPKISSASDIIDATIGVCERFVVLGLQCFSRKSVLPFFERAEYGTFADEQRDIHQKVALYSIGSLETECDMDGTTLGTKISRAIQKGRELERKEKNFFQRRLYSDLIRRIEDDEFLYKRIRGAGNVRPAPFAIALVGSAGTGKTGLVHQIARVFTHANGIEYDTKENFLRWNYDDKYQSEASNKTKVVLLDDIGNEKDPDISPVAPIINLVNNSPCPCPQAEVENKRGIELTPDLVLVTSNVPELNAKLWSNEGYSIVRRIPIWVEPKPMPEYCVPGTTNLDADRIRAAFTDEESAFRCVCKYRVYRYVSTGITNNMTTTYKAETIMDDVHYPFLLRYIAEESKKFRASQQNYVKANKKLSDEKLCGCCSLPQHFCLCEQFDAQANEGRSRYDAMMSYVFSYDSSWLAGVSAWIPPMLSNRLVPVIASCDANLRAARLMLPMIRHMSKCIFLVWPLIFLFPLFFVFSIVPLMFSILFATILYVKAGERYATRRLYESVEQVDWRKWLLYKAAPVGCGVLILYRMRLLTRVLRIVRGAYAAQARVNPTTEEEVRARDATPNFWAKPSLRPLPRNKKRACITPKILKEKCKDALMVAEQLPVDGKGAKDVNCFVFASGFGILPQHFVNACDPTRKVRFVRYDRFAVGSNFWQYVTPDRCYYIPGTDLAVVWLPNTGSKENLLDYFPDRYVDQKCAVFFGYKDYDSLNVVEDRCLAQPCHVAHQHARFHGYVANYSKSTPDGSCMGYYVRDCIEPDIFAFHLGKKGTTGCAGRIKRSDLEDGISFLSSKPGICMSACSCDFRMERPCGKLPISDYVNPRSCVNFITPGRNNLQIYGSFGERQRGISVVKPTLIADSVWERMNILNLWGPPKMRVGYPYQVAMEKQLNGCDDVPPDLLQIATADYVAEILQSLKTLPELTQDIRVLSNEEAISGIPGKTFFDAMALKTAAGIGLTGKKAEWIDDIGPTPLHPVTRTPNEDLRKEIEYVESCWRAGAKSDGIYKACLKDEPTPIDSSKVRVFLSGPLPQYVGAKKLKQGIVRAMRMLPLVSETTVGLNPMGPDWEEVMAHVFRFGDERGIAGDYSGFDKRLPSSVLWAVSAVTQEIAKEYGFSKEELTMLRACDSETIYSMQSYDGALIEVVGSVPSGDPYTVDWDTVAGCLLMRMVLYQFCRDKGIPIPKFRDVIGLVHNGDDHIGSVRKDIAEKGFNMQYISKTLTAWGMKYTATEKDRVIDFDFQDRYEIEYLKRKSVRVPGLPFEVGALNIDSIHKSLCCCIPSKELTPEAHAATVIDGALRELCLHGKSVYEDYRKKLRLVASDHGIEQLVPYLTVPFEAAISTLKNKFSDEQEIAVHPSAAVSGRKAKHSSECMDDHEYSGFAQPVVLGGFTSDGCSAREYPYLGEVLPDQESATSMGGVSTPSLL